MDVTGELPRDGLDSSRSRFQAFIRVDDFLPWLGLDDVLVLSVPKQRQVPNGSQGKERG